MAQTAQGLQLAWLWLLLGVAWFGSNGGNGGVTACTGDKWPPKTQLASARCNGIMERQQASGFGPGYRGQYGPGHRMMRDDQIAYCKGT